MHAYTKALLNGLQALRLFYSSCSQSRILAMRYRDLLNGHGFHEQTSATTFRSGLDCARLAGPLSRPALLRNVMDRE